MCAYCMYHEGEEAGDENVFVTARYFPYLHEMYLHR